MTFFVLCVMEKNLSYVELKSDKVFQFVSYLEKKGKNAITYLSIHGDECKGYLLHQHIVPPVSTMLQVTL